MSIPGREKEQRGSETNEAHVGTEEGHLGTEEARASNSEPRSNMDEARRQISERGLRTNEHRSRTKERWQRTSERRSRTNEHDSGTNERGFGTLVRESITKQPQHGTRVCQKCCVQRAILSPKLSPPSTKTAATCRNADRELTKPGPALTRVLLKVTNATANRQTARRSSLFFSGL
jgi:hypothetical protein